MKPTKEILSVWNRFNDFPLETISKAWYYNKANGSKQRSVELMRYHRNMYGASGNCFDLSLWLLHELKNEGIKAYGIGTNLKTPDAHVAVIAIGEDGYKYLCDLGDQWISPILVDNRSSCFTQDAVNGFFPCAKIKVEEGNGKAKITYLRPNGKQSEQVYSMEPLDMDTLLSAAEHSQNLLRKPLVQMRIEANDEIDYWEFDSWSSFYSTNKDLLRESQLSSNEGAEKINLMTGLNKDFVLKSLNIYSKTKSTT